MRTCMVDRQRIKVVVVYRRYILRNVLIVPSLCFWIYLNLTSRPSHLNYKPKDIRIIIRDRDARCWLTLWSNAQSCRSSRSWPPTT